MQKSDIWLMNQNKVLFIGLVWPEPTSSAAGKRILQLVRFFLDCGCEVIFCSAATKSDASFCFNSLRLHSTTNLKEIPIELNNSSFNELIKELNPNIVVYDRFVSEEQFGWRVSQECPDALQILDTEDLHFLRSARETAFKKNEKINLYNKTTLREIASILRCDLSLLISKFEMNLLQNEFAISPKLLHYLPFLENKYQTWNSRYEKSYEERKDFVFIGNFLHEPNWQTVLHLKKDSWPKIKKHLPTTKLNIYGAYPTQKVWDLHNEKEGFLVHGKAEDALEVLSQARILLAPLLFGAGQKGKFIEAMQVGTPIATTSIGAEAMFDEILPGIVENDENKFVEKTIELYQNNEIWAKSQQNGFQILEKNFNKDSFEENFKQTIVQLQSELIQHRNQNFIGQILKSNTVNALKYMSLWIEEKNN